MSSNRFGIFYSTGNALGILMGTGNVGTYLSSHSDEINTYLSRDGGITWFEIAKGSHIYEYGDHGGLILMAQDQTATSEILYSWNEGLTWEQLEIYEKKIEITNIIIEPSNTGLHFLIYGELEEKGIVIGLDFSGLHQRNCKGAGEANNQDSDYELWNPTEQMNDNCLMGRKVYIDKFIKNKLF